MSQSNQPSAPIYRRPLVDQVSERRFDGDLYGREALAQRLTTLLSRLPDGAVLSVESVWGEGKTWLGKRWRASLADQGFRTVYIDCFQRDHINDPFAMLAGELIELAKSGKSEVRAKILETGKKIGVALLPATAKFAVKAVGHWAIGNANLAEDIASAVESVEEQGAENLERLVAKALEDYESDRRTVDGFRKSLAELASESDKPIVIFVDELDRCRPDFAVHTVERIKHFFDVPGVVFVLLVNRGQLAAAVRGLYGESVDAEAYLAKFIQLSLTLPKSRSIERHGRDDNRKHVEAELSRYGLGGGEGASSFASMMGILGTLFDLSLRDMERAVALYSFAQPLNTSAVFVSWPIALKLAKPELFKRLLTHDPNAHMEAYKLAASLKQQAPDADFLIGFFEELHNCGSSSFAKALASDYAQTLRSQGQGYWRDAKSYLTWVLERIDLSVSQ